MNQENRKPVRDRRARRCRKRAGGACFTVVTAICGYPITSST
jgi:hypothetical protein